MGFIILFGLFALVVVLPVMLFENSQRRSKIEQQRQILRANPHDPIAAATLQALLADHLRRGGI
jgi:hypothetical protein